MGISAYRCYFVAPLLALAACGTTTESELQANAADRDEVICRNMVPTGSHLPKRVCFRESEIEASHDPALRQLFDRMQDHAGAGISRDRADYNSN